MRNIPIRSALPKNLSCAPQLGIESILRMRIPKNVFQQTARLVSHHAIEHHLRASAQFYDFMAGDDQHKQSLATNVHSLACMVAQRRELNVRIENALRHLKQTLAPQ